MQFYRFYLYLFFFLIFSMMLQAKEVTYLKKLCFTTSQESELCLKEDNSTILMPKNIAIDEYIYILQTIIRAFVDDEKKNKLVLLSEGFEGTLLSIGQGNLLPYYRENIHGIILKNSMANYYELCQLENTREHNKSCMRIENFYQELNGQASKVEVLKALSSALQMDWYTPKVILLDLEKEEKIAWIKAFEENGLNYEFKSSPSKINLEEYFSFQKSSKIQPKIERLDTTHYGVILRYHLGKITYRTKHKILQTRKDYGLDKKQKYEVFYRENSKNNPLFIYVHGGGWNNGDKENFYDLCKQYADKGFTAIALNYRLLLLPKVEIEDMVEDVNHAIINIMKRANEYGFNSKETLLMGDSTGALLSYMAISKLPQEYKVQKVIFNSIPTNLKLFSKEKLVTLLGVEDDSRQSILAQRLSPLFNLMDYDVPTLAIHGLKDNVVLPKHLETLEVQSVIHSNNITSLWIENASHPIVAKAKALQPSYLDIQKTIDKFIEFNP